MPYIDVVFQNIRSSLGIIAAGQAYYDAFPGIANVGQGNAGPFVAAAAPSAAWGGSVTGAVTSAGIFLCETPGYGNFYHNWDPPNVVAGGNVGLAPATNLRCVYLRGGAPGAPGPAAGVAPAVANQVGGAHWFGRSLFGSNHCIRCLGTGAVNFPPLAVPAAPPGTDRYALLFQADWPYSGTAQRVTGLFVHTKNTAADPGTQIAALCRLFPNDIIFGDLNLNLRQAHKEQSLAFAVGGTHTILAIRQAAGGGNYYFTHYLGMAGASTLDYALVPNAQVAHVELWAHDPGAGVPRLSVNGSDHSVMMLRIRV
jgi:hypothetical protein